MHMFHSTSGKKIIHRCPHLYRRFIFQNVTLWGAENLRSRWWRVQPPGLGGSKGRFACSGGWYAAIGNGCFFWGKEIWVEDNFKPRKSIYIISKYSCKMILMRILDFVALLKNKLPSLVISWRLKRWCSFDLHNLDNPSWIYHDLQKWIVLGLNDANIVLENWIEELNSSIVTWFHPFTPISEKVRCWLNKTFWQIQGGLPARHLEWKRDVDLHGCI